MASNKGNVEEVESVQVDGTVSILYLSPWGQRELSFACGVGGPESYQALPGGREQLRAGDWYSGGAGGGHYPGDYQLLPTTKG